MYISSTSVANSVVVDTSETSDSILTKRLCTCKVCTDISYGHADHLCCQQMKLLWVNKICDDENVECVTHSKAFNGACNSYAIRGLLLGLHHNNIERVTDPPSNYRMRYGAYTAAAYFLFGPSNAKPLPSHKTSNNINSFESQNF